MAAEFNIRLIEPRDNQGVYELVIAVLTEFGCIGPGYASGDAELLDMHNAYVKVGGKYWVIEEASTGRVVGGGGFSRLKGTTSAQGVCELQKLYFLPELRGKGLGKKLLALIIEEAGKAEFREMYLETIPPMQQAIGLYRHFGFDYIPAHKGATGHHQKCQVYMSRALGITDPVA